MEVGFTTTYASSAYHPQALVSLKKCMPPPLPYFKVNICPFPLLHFASVSVSVCIKYVDGSTSGFYFDAVGCAMQLSKNVGEQF
jgi:hypothetical protein